MQTPIGCNIAPTRCNIASSRCNIGLSLFHGTARHIPEHFTHQLFSETEQLFNISLHVNSSCLGLWSDI